MKFLIRFMVSSSIALSLALATGAAEVEWTPEANMDHQLFPSLLIATATARPDDDEDEERAPDPYLLGDEFGLVGVSTKAPAAHTKVPRTCRGKWLRVDKQRPAS